MYIINFLLVILSCSKGSRFLESSSITWVEFPLYVNINFSSNKPSILSNVLWMWKCYHAFRLCHQCLNQICYLARLMVAQSLLLVLLVALEIYHVVVLEGCEGRQLCELFDSGENV